MNDGKELDEAKIQKAITGKGLKMTSFAKSEAIVPDMVYQLKVSGGG